MIALCEVLDDMLSVCMQALRSVVQMLKEDSF